MLLLNNVNVITTGDSDAYLSM